MLWQLLRGAAPSYTTDEYGLPAGEAVDPTKLDLDAVDPDICGKANMKQLPGMVKDFTFGWRAIMVITTLTFFIREVAPPVCVRRLESDENWDHHFVQLKTFGLIATIGEGLVKYVCTYFGIPKSSGGARSIFNGKRFSKLCKTPPPTNIPDIVRVLKVLETLFRDCDRPVMICGDIRHYFHQLPLDSDIGRFFCLLRNGVFWRWCSVPMGWSWSPWIAQSIAMSLILVTLERCGFDVSVYKGTTNPPPMIILRDSSGKTCLVATLWYDNIMIATTLVDKGRKIHSMLKKVFEEKDSANLQLKEWDLFGPRSFNKGERTETQKPDNQKIGEKGPRRRPKYLGLEFAMIRVRSGEGFVNQLHWRIEQEKLDEWKKLADTISPHMTCRVVAKLAGTVLWHTHIALQPLCNLHHLIRLVRRCGELCPKKKDWDVTHCWSNDQIAELQDRLSWATTSQWHSVTWNITEQELVVATDSSGKRWGRCVWNSDQSLLETVGRDWGADIVKATIFIKELAAAVMALEHWCPLMPLTRILLLIDNTAAAAVLTRLASVTHAGNELARRAHEVLKRYGCELEVITITSEQNPADQPSRRQPLRAERVDLIWRILTAHSQGSRIDTVPKPWSGTNTLGLRHAEDEGLEDVSTSDDDDHLEDFWDSETEEDI